MPITILKFGAGADDRQVRLMDDRLPREDIECECHEGAEDEP